MLMVRSEPGGRPSGLRVCFSSRAPGGGGLWSPRLPLSRRGACDCMWERISYEDVHWIYKDSWPATLDGMKSALSDANVTLSSDLSDGANEYVDMNKTLSDAIDECRRSYTGEGNADCRMVAVGYARLGNGARPDRPPPGYAADLNLLDPTDWTVQHVWCAGRQVK